MDFNSAMGLEPVVDFEDDEDDTAPRPGDPSPIFMWSPEASVNQALTRPSLLLIAIGEKPVVFASSLIHANGWNCPSVATVVMPHSPITACPGLVNDPSSSAIPSLWASKQNTIMQIIPSSVSDQVVLMFSVQQDIVAHDASVLVDAVMAQIQPQKLLILDTIKRGDFVVDTDSLQHSSSRSLIRVIDSALARTDDQLKVQAPAAYLAPPNMLNSVGSAFLSYAHMHSTWARLLAAVDFEPDAVESVIAFATSARSVLNVIKDVLQTSAELKSHAPESIAKSLVLKHWMQTRARKSFPHV